MSWLPNNLIIFFSSPHNEQDTRVGWMMYRLVDAAIKAIFKDQYFSFNQSNKYFARQKCASPKDQHNKVNIKISSAVANMIDSEKKGK